MTLLGNKTLTQENVQKETAAGLQILHRMCPMAVLKACQIPDCQRHRNNRLLL